MHVTSCLLPIESPMTVRPGADVSPPPDASPGCCSTEQLLCTKSSAYVISFNSDTQSAPLPSILPAFWTSPPQQTRLQCRGLSPCIPRFASSYVGCPPKIPGVSLYLGHVTSQVSLTGMPVTFTVRDVYPDQVGRETPPDGTSSLRAGSYTRSEQTPLGVSSPPLGTSFTSPDGSAP